jgi:hypothetical protein
MKISFHLVGRSVGKSVNRPAGWIEDRPVSLGRSISQSKFGRSRSVRPSVPLRSVGPVSVGRSVGQSVGRSVGRAIRRPGGLNHVWLVVCRVCWAALGQLSFRVRLARSPKSGVESTHQNHSYSYSRGNSRTSELLTTRVVTHFGTHQYGLCMSSACQRDI